MERRRTDAGRDLTGDDVGGLGGRDVHTELDVGDDRRRLDDPWHGMGGPLERQQ